MAKKTSKHNKNITYTTERVRVRDLVPMAPAYPECPIENPNASPVWVLSRLDPDDLVWIFYSSELDRKSYFKPEAYETPLGLRFNK